MTKIETTGLDDKHKKLADAVNCLSDHGLPDNCSVIIRDENGNLFNVDLTLGDLREICVEPNLYE